MTEPPVASKHLDYISGFFAKLFESITHLVASMCLVELCILMSLTATVFLLLIYPRIQQDWAVIYLKPTNILRIWTGAPELTIAIMGFVYLLLTIWVESAAGEAILLFLCLLFGTIVALFLLRKNPLQFVEVLTYKMSFHKLVLLYSRESIYLIDEMKSTYRDLKSNIEIDKKGELSYMERNSDTNYVRKKMKASRFYSQTIVNGINIQEQLEERLSENLGLSSARLVDGIFMFGAKVLANNFHKQAMNCEERKYLIEKRDVTKEEEVKKNILRRIDSLKWQDRNFDNAAVRARNQISDITLSEIYPWNILKLAISADSTSAALIQFTKALCHTSYYAAEDKFDLHLRLHRSLQCGYHGRPLAELLLTSTMKIHEQFSDANIVTARTTACRIKLLSAICDPEIRVSQEEAFEAAQNWPLQVSMMISNCRSLIQESFKKKLYSELKTLKENDYILLVVKGYSRAVSGNIRQIFRQNPSLAKKVRVFVVTDSNSNSISSERSIFELEMEENIVPILRSGDLPNLEASISNSSDLVIYLSGACAILDNRTVLSKESYSIFENLSENCRFRAWFLAGSYKRMYADNLEQSEFRSICDLNLEAGYDFSPENLRYNFDSLTSGNYLLRWQQDFITVISDDF